MSGPRRDISAVEQAAMLATARALVSNSVPWYEIARKLGVGESWLKRRLVAGHAEKENTRVRSRKMCDVSRKAEHRPPLTKEETLARRALIPQDSRDFTARWFGDPIPNDPRRSV